MTSFIRLVAALLLASSVLSARQADGANAKVARVLFETGFERFEGYDSALDLVDSSGRGQNGWTSVGYGGNGILADVIPDFSGQYAYIGFLPSTNRSGFFNVFRPIRFTPTSNSPPVLVFHVTMSIRDEHPAAATADDFRWSVYTPDDKRLFTVDFHGTDQTINFALDDNEGFQETGYLFDYGATYDLEITMSFGRNRWSAALNGTTVIFEERITTRGTTLALGSIDAVWAANASGTWDDNYLLFDDYRITAYPPADIASLLEVTGVAANGTATVRIWGEPGVSYLVRSTNDFITWTDRGTVVATAPDGIATFQDAQPAAARFYQVVSIP